MEQLPITFPAGLTREEYIQAGLLQTRGGKVFRVLSLICAGLFLLLWITDVAMMKTVDVPFTVIMAAVIASLVAVSIILPRTEAERHGDTYDQTLYSGYCFEGEVTVSATQITKRTPSGETVIPFGQCSFLETKEMLVFRGFHGKGIILPARCLTKEDAEIARGVALQEIPPANRRLLQRIQPQLTERLPAPSQELPTPKEAEVTMAVAYTKREMVGIFVDAAFEGLPRTLPTKILIAAAVAALVYDQSSYAMVGVFLLAAVALLVFPLLLAPFRVGRGVKATDGKVLQLTVWLSPDGVRLEGEGEHGRRLTVPWSHITRAVELPGRVEFYARHKKFISIPKRCIADMEALRRVVDTHLPQR